jgi:hypothetical protein
MVSTRKGEGIRKDDGGQRKDAGALRSLGGPQRIDPHDE